MTDQPTEGKQKRDELLLTLLKTPPQPRPKRERGKRPSEDRKKPCTDETPEPSA